VFLEKMPHLRGVVGLTLFQGDVRAFEFPAGRYGFAIHAATDASARQMAEQPEEMRSTIVAGTERMLAFAAAAGTHKLLLTSSGAVYGTQPGSISHMTEAHPLSPETIYGAGKRTAELMCEQAATDDLQIKIARCYAFMGPHLPLDAHFAAGNFLADALAGRTIRIASDGSSVRSYLYAPDLAIWLWTMLFRAPSLRPYNVGSEEAIDIRRLAEKTVEVVNPAVAVEIARAAEPASTPHRYVPSTARARAELGLRQAVSLEDALHRTAAWHRLE
jgi:dTDP-glucose 4,6-dehydratase